MLFRSTDRSRVITIFASPANPSSCRTRMARSRSVSRSGSGSRSFHPYLNFNEEECKILLRKAQKSKIDDSSEDRLEVSAQSITSYEYVSRSQQYRRMKKASGIVGISLLKAASIINMSADSDSEDPDGSIRNSLRLLFEYMSTKCARKKSGK